MLKNSIILVLVLSLAGCTNAYRAQIGGFGSNYKVTLYSGGVAVKEWRSTGKVLTEHESDGWYFMDSETGKLIRVSGQVVIEQL